MSLPQRDGYTIDWRNYLERAATTDPVAFAEQAMAAANSGAVWFVTGIGYRGVDPACATVQAHLASVRPAEQVVGLTDLFEGMYAIRYAPS